MSALTWLLLRQQRITAELLKAQAAALVASQRQVQLKQLEVVDKAVALVRAADPWQYQAIQAMQYQVPYDADYDPSPEAEARRIAERDSAVDDMEGEMNADERAVFGDLFPGA